MSDIHSSLIARVLNFFESVVVPFLLAMSQKLYGAKPVVETPPLSANIVRNLSDKLYEKRKMGALELEQLIRDSKDAKDTEKINTIINFITSQFALSSSGNQRKGGLIALAATAIGLGAVHLSPAPPCIPLLWGSHDEPFDVGVPCRKHGDTSTSSCRPCSSASATRTAGCDTTRARPCTTSPRWPAAAPSPSSTKSSKAFAAYAPLPYGYLFFFSASPMSLTFVGGPGVVVLQSSRTQLSADKDLNVKNGAQLLDRLIKDIVTESDAFDIER